jgi:hypothetical protein
MPPNVYCGKPGSRIEGRLMQKLDRAFHERVALDLLQRDGIGIVWKLHLDAANAYRGRYLRGAQILIETADAAERLIRHAARSELARHTE